MKNALRLAAICGLLAVQLAAQTDVGAMRAFSYPEEVVNVALARLNATQGGRLPALDDFAMVEAGERSHYSVPYYQLAVETKADAGGNTLVSVSAHITALYNDPHSRKSEYQTLPSNGHLEQDLLDRLEHELSDQGGGKALDRKALEQSINDMRAQRQAAEARRAELKKEIAALEAKRPEKAPVQVVTVNRAGVAVHAAPAEAAPVVLRTQARDQFEMAQEQEEWTEVRLGEGKSGWLRSSETRAVDIVAGLRPAQRTDFEVMRENVVPFAGNWPELKGKPTLFLWVRSTGSFRAGGLQNRWEYARQLFEERAQTTKNVEGIVVLFAGDGGVAAATVKDIRRWSEGALSDAAFRARCSLDPPRAFAESSSKASKDNPGQ